jgi:hypothetical protein
MKKWEMEVSMKFLKYISLFVFILSGVNCLGMEFRENVVIPSFDDMDINHTLKEGTHSGDFSELVELTYKGEGIGHIEYTLLHVQDEDDVVRKFIQDRLQHNPHKIYSKGALSDCLAVFEQSNYIIVLDHLKIYSAYQKNGLGRLFLDYFLHTLRQNYEETVVCLKPQQNFTKKSYERDCTKEELQQRLVTFYKSFGADYIPTFDTWMYIPLGK